IVFGSDIPFLSQTHQIGRIIFADISEEDKKKILCDNPKKILGK
ncbi:MAG: metal-dependent hydrolase, partial [Candidatus Omnitrophota bacterium]